MKRTARLKPIVNMHEEYCCGNGCTRIATSHANLLENWRKRASTCQKEARRVIAEMLTPTGGTKANCYRFIKMVTGKQLDRTNIFSYFFFLSDNLLSTRLKLRMLCDNDLFGE